MVLLRHLRDAAVCICVVKRPLLLLHIPAHVCPGCGSKEVPLRRMIPLVVYEGLKTFAREGPC
jgi:hypothetical protein